MHPAPLSAERVHDREDRGSEQDDEHRREDEEDQGEEDLDRRPLRALLRLLTPALAHLDGEVAHDLTDRDAERLALGDRAYERAHGRCLTSREQVAERLL